MCTLSLLYKEKQSKEKKIYGEKILERREKRNKSDSRKKRHKKKFKKRKRKPRRNDVRIKIKIKDFIFLRKSNKRKKRF